MTGFPKNDSSTWHKPQLQWEIDEARYASQDDFYPGIIFVVFDSEDDSKEYFKKEADRKIEKIKDKDLDAKITTKSSDDYEKIAIKGEIFEGSEGYTVIIRIKNTVLLVYRDGDSKSDVKTVDDIVSKLGY